MRGRAWIVCSSSNLFSVDDCDDDDDDAPGAAPDLAVVRRDQGRLPQSGGIPHRHAFSRAQKVMQYSTLQCSAVQYITVQCSIVLYSTVLRRRLNVNHSEY